MANKPIPSNPIADLPANWVGGQIVSPNGTEVGLSQKYGYNYLNSKVNEVITDIGILNDAFPELLSGYVSYTEDYNKTAEEHRSARKNLGLESSAAEFSQNAWYRIAVINTTNVASAELAFGISGILLITRQYNSNPNESYMVAFTGRHQSSMSFTNLVSSGDEANHFVRGLRFTRLNDNKIGIEIKYSATRVNTIRFGLFIIGVGSGTLYEFITPFVVDGADVASVIGETSIGGNQLTNTTTELLWENASPTSSYGINDIQIDNVGNDYKFLIVSIRVSTSNAEETNCIIRCANGVQSDVFLNTARNIGRVVTTYANSIHISACYYQTAVGTLANSGYDTYGVPIRIWGVK